MTVAGEFRHVPAQPPLPGLEEVKLTGGTETPLYPEDPLVIDLPPQAGLRTINDFSYTAPEEWMKVPKLCPVCHIVHSYMDVIRYSPPAASLEDAA